MCSAATHSEPRSPRRAFSLVEVVLALGVASLSLVVILGLVPALGAAQREAGEQARARHLGEAVEALLTGEAAGNFDALVAGIPPAAGGSHGGLELVSDRAGARVTRRDGAGVDAIARSDHFYLIECWRADGESGGATPLVVLQVRISWPLTALDSAGPRRECTVLCELMR